MEENKENTTNILEELDKKLGGYESKVSKVPYICGLIARIIGIIGYSIGGYKLICLIVPIDIEIYLGILFPFVMGYLITCFGKQFDWYYRITKNPLASIESNWGGF